MTREGRWWMVHVPEIDVLTHARRVSEIELMAREAIAVTLDAELSDIATDVSFGVVAEIHVGEKVALIHTRTEVAAELKAEAEREAVQLAKGVASAEVSLRDIGTVLGGFAVASPPTR